MKNIFSVLILVLCLSSCSNNKSFVIVEESEFGDWQWEVGKIYETLDSMNLSDTDDENVANIFNELDKIRERMKKLDNNIHKNFLHSDEIGSRGLPTRYMN